MPRYKIADVVFEAQTLYDYSVNLCKEYEYHGNEPSQFTAVITPEEIADEKSRAPEYSEGYLESLALFRKLCEYVLANADGLVFHSSAIAVDGQAYLFAAPSGTGKSTHARLWKKMLGDKMIYINDDKPLVRYIDGEFYVYGTPWNGKHRLSTNSRAKVKAICSIYQAKENRIEKISTGEMLPIILNQTIRPSDKSLMINLLDLTDKLLRKVELYKLGCNISLEAAQLSYETMSKGDEYED